jgi:hypothetical protein
LSVVVMKHLVLHPSKAGKTRLAVEEV